MKQINSVLDVIDSHIDSFIKWRVMRNCNYDCLYCVQHRQCEYEHFTLDEEWNTAIKVTKEINRIIEELPGKTVKLDLIGGEITLFDLVKLLELIPSKKLKKIHITTNFSRPIDYFYKLVDYLDKRNIQLSLCTSYHSEYNTPEDFINKIILFRDYIKGKDMEHNAEAVSSHFNLEEITRFRDLCKENNIPYMIDADIRYIIKQKEREMFISENSCDKNKISSDTKEFGRYPRFLTIYDDKTYKYYGSNNVLRTNIKENPQATGRGLKLKGYYCSKDVNYVYIMGDKHNGFITEDCCGKLEPIADFHPRKDFLKCPHDVCSLCGRMSHSKDIDILTNWIYEKKLPIE